MPKSRIFLFLLLAFLVGVALRSFVIIPIFLLWLLLLAAVALTTVGFLGKNNQLVIFGFIFLVLVAGAFRFEIYERQKPDLAPFNQKSVYLVGEVSEEPEFKGTWQKLKLNATVLNHHPLKKYFLLELTARRYPSYHLGETLMVEGVLETATGGIYESQGLQASIFYPAITVLSESKGIKLKIILARIKQAFEEKIDWVLPEPHAAFLKGLLLGERSSLPQNLLDDFKKTGTTHIVALSGYNVTIVGRFLISLLSFFATPFLVSFWLATAGIMFFVFITGASASVVRAGIMGILVLMATREGRAYHITNALALAAAFMVFQNPAVLRFDAGFQLSFLATIGLVYLSPHVKNVLNSWKIGWAQDQSLTSQIGQTFVETVSAQLMVFPLINYLFGRVSIISPLPNILVLLTIPYSMLLGFAAGVAGFLFAPLSQFLGWCSWVLLQYQMSIIKFFAKVPAGSLSLGKWGAAVILALWLAMIFKIWVRPLLQNKDP